MLWVQPSRPHAGPQCLAAAPLQRQVTRQQTCQRTEAEEEDGFSAVTATGCRGCERGVVVVGGGHLHVGVGGRREVLSWISIFIFEHFLFVFVFLILSGTAGKPSIYSAAAAADLTGLPRSRDACHALHCRRGGGTGSLRWLARHPGTSKETKTATKNQQQQQFGHMFKKIDDAC